MAKQVESSRLGQPTVVGGKRKKKRQTERQTERECTVIGTGAEEEEEEEGEFRRSALA